jgi:benzoyl-CoA reductase subunit D
MVPEARAVLDVGALHARAIVIDERGRVLRYRMTSQCASGSGQFLENISRYLGVALEEIGSLSLESTNPEKCSSICAVLAETDVINMVSRGIRTADILKGIHLSMASRFVKLLEATEARGTVAITGGLSADRGLFQALSEEAERSKAKIRFATCPDAVHAGAIGAAVLGDYRLGKLKALGAAPLRRGASTGS